MRCLNALSEWDQLISSVQEEPDSENRRLAMPLAANAAMNLGKWDLLETFSNDCLEDKVSSSDRSFWKAAVAVAKGQYKESKLLIADSILKMDSQVSGLLLESYSRAYGSILRLQ